MKKTWIEAGLLAGLMAGPAAAVDCRHTDFDGAGFTLCTVQPDQDLRLFLNDAAGRRFGQFSAVEAAVGPLSFAMNAGMYHADYSPVGLYIEEGRQVTPLVTDAGPGNFGLLPNGVFCLGEGFAVIEARQFQREAPACRFATQSGPMLVIDGALHPRFIPDSDSRYVRNGVGVLPDGAAVFAISDGAVNFDHFGRLFRDALGVRNALYLDGSISRLHAPGIGRSDFGFAMGPIVAVIAP